MDKYLLLTAKEYRSWIIPCKEWEWEAISWRIYSDGSYRTTLTFRPFWGNRDMRKKLRRVSGMIPQNQFDMLLNQLKIDNWGEPNRDDMVCDGPMWEIKQYSLEGVVIGSSGKINFIEKRQRRPSGSLWTAIMTIISMDGQSSMMAG